MNYFIQTDSSNYIVGQYEGNQSLSAPWIPVTAGQFASIVPGSTWVNNAVVQPVQTALTLAQAQAAQIMVLSAAYQTASEQPVSFTTAGGVTKTFQADAGSQTLLLQAFTGYNAQGAVPPEFYWRSLDNTNVPFTLADLKGLYAIMLAQGWAAFQVFITQKTAVMAATTNAAVEAIVW